jgi:hypothetical protein
MTLSSPIQDRDHRWYKGSDGLYHWVDCWLIGHCGHHTFFGESKEASELDTHDCCESCLMEFFYEVVCKPFNQPEGVRA